MTKIDGFQETVSKVWNQNCWYGDPLAILSCKLKAVKTAIIQLNKNHGNVHTNCAVARDKLHDIQVSLNSDAHNECLLNQEQNAIKNLNTCLLEEEALLLQKSRVQWLSLGDGNTKFFFNQVTPCSPMSAATRRCDSTHRWCCTTAIFGDEFFSVADGLVSATKLAVAKKFGRWWACFL